MKHVKENDLVHGQWERWCREEIGMTPQNVNRFVKVYDELGDSNRNTYFDLGVQTLYLIATLPEPEREKLHTIPSTGDACHILVDFILGGVKGKGRNIIDGLQGLSNFYPISYWEG